MSAGRIIRILRWIEEEGDAGKGEKTQGGMNPRGQTLIQRQTRNENYMLRIF